MNSKLTSSCWQGIRVSSYETSFIHQDHKELKQMDVFTELLACPLPRNTSPAGLFLNSKPLSSWKRTAIFLNQLCKEMFSSSPNKQGISSLPLLSYSGPKPMTTSSCCILRASRARDKCWHPATAMSVAKHSSSFTWTKVSPIGKIPSALLRGTAHTRINENPIYQLWAWNIFVQRKPNSDGV